MLALATNPVDGASTRFRVEQWRDHLRAEGVELQLEPFYPLSASGFVYQEGRALAKIRQFSEGAARRVDLLRKLPALADVLFVHREAFPLGWSVLLNRIERFPGAIIYDYDDALFVPQRSGRGILEWVERVDTPARLMRISDVVLAGNPFLAEYARRFSDRVILLPTCIDTDRFKPREHLQSQGRCTVGWIGSHSTAKYLQGLIPALERAAACVPFDLYVVGGPVPISAKGIGVVQAPWSLDREVEDFQRCDIGVYPLWTDEWSQGKSGFKAIQFMACGILVIASPVGVTRDIIQTGVNGLLSSTVEEWASTLVRLVSDLGFRMALGAAGRRTIERRYSVTTQAFTFTSAVREAIARAVLRRGVRG